MRRIVVALAAALLPARMHGQGASSMHPIDFDGDGDIDIVKSSPIGIVWLENHGVRAGAPETTRGRFQIRRRLSRRAPTRRRGTHTHRLYRHRSTRNGRRILFP